MPFIKPKSVRNTLYSSDNVRAKSANEIYMLDEFSRIFFAGVVIVVVVISIFRGKTTAVSKALWQQLVFKLLK